MLDRWRRYLDNRGLLSGVQTLVATAALVCLATLNAILEPMPLLAVVFLAGFLVAFVLKKPMVRHVEFTAKALRLLFFLVMVGLIVAWAFKPAWSKQSAFLMPLLGIAVFYLMAQFWLFSDEDVLTTRGTVAKVKRYNRRHGHE